jgi:hypothetical protein
MTKRTALDFEVDKLTNSIENTLTGEIFETEITILSDRDGKQINKKDWQFDWHIELNDSINKVYKLTTINNPLIIHGLISLIDNHDHIFMPLIESAKFNKGRKKQYRGVAGNLVAFACKNAFEKKYMGIVMFIAKTKLIEHYKLTLGAKVFRGNKMFIDTTEALTLVKQYFKDFNYDEF